MDQILRTGLAARTQFSGTTCTVEQYLGGGGQGEVYRASLDGQAVALKVPHEGCLADRTFVTRFLREGKLGEQLHHPRIVRIFAAGEDNGRPFLAMEVVEGHTLKQEITGPRSRRARHSAAPARR